MIRCCIFDLDGTLLNTIDDLAASCNHALSEFGYAEHETDEYRHFVGNGVTKLIERAAPGGIAQTQISELQKAFETYYAAHFMDKTAPYGEVEALLRVLKLGGVHTCVVSNKPDAFTRGLVATIFGEKFFDAVLGASADTPKKPDPTGVLRCVQKLALTKSECVYIGDSDVDVFTAKKAGLLCIGAAWGFRGRQELAAAGADFIAETPMDIVRLIALDAVHPHSGR